jgi:signal transduction histidine kinase
VTVSGDGREVRLEIADTGPGVPPELRSQIFEPFFTTKLGRGGTGLGLAITRDIVRAHGGSIEVRENVPHGTVVGIAFPATGETPS